MREERQKKKQNRIWQVLWILCLLGLVCSLVWLVIDQVRQQKQESKLEELAAIVNEPAGDNTVPGTEAAFASEETGSEDAVPEDPLEAKLAWLKETYDITVPKKELAFRKLQEETNPDIYAWIYIPDTKIDYPVLQHPSDNTYYLNYNLDGSKGYPGCIYTENYNSKNFTDRNTVLYGHNMKDGSMFAGLHKYEDSQYFEEHPYIYIYTPEDVFVYQIFAAYEFSNAHLLQKYEITTDQGFANYLQEIADVRSMNCVRNEEITPTVEDHLITLSTCIANKPNNRFLVQGVLLDED